MRKGEEEGWRDYCAPATVPCLRAPCYIQPQPTDAACTLTSQGASTTGMPINLSSVLQSSMWCFSILTVRLEKRSTSSMLPAEQGEGNGRKKSDKWELLAVVELQGMEWA